MTKSYLEVADRQTMEMYLLKIIHLSFSQLQTLQQAQSQQKLENSQSLQPEFLQFCLCSKSNYEKLVWLVQVLPCHLAGDVQHWTALLAMQELT